MTGSIRLFVPFDLGPGATPRASEAQAHYLARVMRRGIGDEVRLFNGRDGEWRARLARVGGDGRAGRDGVGLEVLELARVQCAGPDLWLLLPQLRRERTEWAVEKATELGAARIAFVDTARTGPARPNLARLGAIATEAAEQCERLDVPVLDAPRRLPDILAAWPAGRTLFAAIERSAAAPPPAADDTAAALLVGPEGGFHPDELDVMRQAPFLVPASLGPRILRAETAAIAGLVLLQARTTG